MKEHGLILTKENRLASVEGRKTQTRRIIGLDAYTLPNTEGRISKDGVLQFRCPPENVVWRDMFWGNNRPPKSRHSKPITPRHQVGDHLYMLEPYQITHADKKYVLGNYLDDDILFDELLLDKEWDKFTDRKKPHMKTSSRFMYKSLARYWFEVTQVRCERLQDISLEDIRAEGLEFTEWADGSIMRTSWKNLWDSINKKRGYGWDENPWVWVYEYKRVTI